ncbi:MAG: hypothetical protein A2931_03590 [Candidatus Niyogibacteria bacterium RIFCSPLOWO2_01_FULL_45_48]|uniref:ATP-grasp domain-containing protein n=2 Tax=Candidatus Niyogiibacteriota TaxID=1817912 RepID=A0A1G2EWI4_9BACT|nr:MAG: hypothetical protein A2835_01440 [Candidatus Niyogibacteria bacterium RIFCSPHIGHO2_01_FULL_45_28]OGZ30165.1 MAG: hypothetical protein A3J00_00665 [Candidatus Niyogibacteria bacterium RIFCSPLOWO2_02_FULL_45_13]OGZ30911.1 MAG: hypothetical protein A2931_03590 [Candidatus Niyogibacteria bacterium RIFCSPLOWO2_01_FULL_45_48]
MKLEGKNCLLLYNAASGNPPEDSAETDSDSSLNARGDIKAVRHALREAGFNVRTLGLRRTNSKTSALIEEMKPDLVFNLCEVLYNHPHKALTEMYVAGWLELMKLPYTGSPPLSLGISLNKMRCKQILKTSGLPIPPSITVQVGEKPNLEPITPPFIVKPLREDGSFGITKDSVVETPQEVEEKVTMIHEKYSQPALVEEFIDGREFTVAVIDNPPRVLGIGEVDFSKIPAKDPKILSYGIKWAKNGLGVGLKFPAQIETALKNRIEKISLKAFRALGCRDYARIDIRISENRRPYILEVNPNPDLSPDEEFGLASEKAGITYESLIKEIAENAVRRGTTAS